MQRILVIEDDETIRKVISKMLGSAGHEVECPITGADALECLQPSRYDIVLTDMFMPDIDGMDVMRIARGLDPRPSIVCMSGGGSVVAHNYLEAAPDLGADAVLPKPFTMAELIGVVDSLS